MQEYYNQRMCPVLVWCDSPKAGLPRDIRKPLVMDPEKVENDHDYRLRVLRLHPLVRPRIYDADETVMVWITPYIIETKGS